jgi:hypothetical protein
MLKMWMKKVLDWKMFGWEKIKYWIFYLIGLSFIKENSYMCCIVELNKN